MMSLENVILDKTKLKNFINVKFNFNIFCFLFFIYKTIKRSTINVHNILNPVDN